ncbi:MULTISPECIES: ATP-grasp peptide maturase system methyltransferase [unclassified Streptomyces]|uniref:ATP-grasp peptide maturase system methyltransferase n=1 Tax=unclassified Streptomyces TaxID=2593676 RepID=UPI00081D8B9C|nr:MULTISPECIES: ATP-grasp peptide maturase system methyltransferase [unclassified Streptomyces]MYZ37983.1 methyltransferase domain-containing protein [Streptomyces sp. SID4917]SCF95495.1 methyltransferase, ATP-grasp peptide maturase system [Streptomyces sp. MnatMP-M17]
MTSETHLRRHLADTLTANGTLRTQPWKNALEATGRHEFLRDGFFQQIEGAVPSAWTPVLPDNPQWLPACYTDTSLVTQIAGTIVPTDIHGHINRLPTSSSTLPSLVIRMLEDLHADDGMHVLEIGTGTGYSTALLSHRLGADLVTSIEYDEDVATRARASLARTGQLPHLVVADGLDGYKANSPYDRIIATCAVHTVPAAWIEQTRPGGQILTTIGGWLGSSELARLTVTDHATASGPLLPGHVSFMFARPHQPPKLGMLPDLDDGHERETRYGIDVLHDWTTRFIAQLAAPRAQHITLTRNGRDEHIILDVAAGTWAALHEHHDARTVRQGGPGTLWNDIEEHLDQWHTAGSPPLDTFTVTVSPHSQSIHW